MPAHPLSGLESTMKEFTLRHALYAVSILLAVAAAVVVAQAGSVPPQQAVDAAPAGMAIPF